MSRRISKIMKKLAPRDFAALKSIYDFRCLSFQQVYELHYKFSEKTGGVVSDDYAKRKFSNFKKSGLIDEDYPTKGESVFFLTPDGVKVVREYFNMPNNIYDDLKQMHRKGFLTSSELRVAPRFISHQYHLNKFVLSFIGSFEGVPYRYEDEKHIKSLVGIRPDGIFSIYNTDFFLEMDMGTENEAQLKEKWDNYRRFIGSQEFLCKERKIVVLFIVDGIKQIDRRITLIKKTILDQLDDLISLDMEFYFDTHENLLHLLQNKIIPQERGRFLHDNFLKASLNKIHGFSIARGSSVRQYFNNEEYAYFIFNKNRDAPLEFVVSTYFLGNISAISQMLYFEARRSGYLNKFKRNVSMLIIVDNVDSFLEDIRKLDLIIPSCCYFSTLADLKNKDFNNAIYSLTTAGERFPYK